jgi:transposase
VTTAFAWFVGIDWGGEEHAICLLDARGQVCGERRVAHTAAAVHDTLEWIRERTGAPPEAIAVAIETPRGVLVDTMIEQRFSVFAINPKQLDRFRDRFTAGGAKDDRRDAHVLGDSLRTDAQAFQLVRADDPRIIELRELCRIVEELQQEERRLTNRLRDQLFRIDAPWLALSPAADDPWLWALLRDTPTPVAWPQLARRHVTAVLRTHRIRRLTVDDVMRVLQQPRLVAAAGVADAVGLHIASLVPRLTLVHEQRTAAERRIDRCLAALPSAEAAAEEPREHRDVEILLSLPGVGRMVTATMLTEATSAIADRDYDRLRTYGGSAPVTKRSGKRAYFVHMRYACNPRLRNALYYWALCSLPLDPAARAYYDALRARGHSHARALRSVANRWLRTLVAMLRAGTLYDPSQPRCRITAAA